MAQERDGAFKCIKIALIVIHSIAIFVVGIAFIIFAVLLASVPNSDQTQQQKDNLKIVAIVGIVYFAIALLMEIIGLIGIIKENKCIVITLFVFSILGVIGNAIQYGIVYGLIGLGVTILTGVYAYMIVKYDRMMV